MEGEARRRKNPDYRGGEGESEICERRERKEAVSMPIPFL